MRDFQHDSLGFIEEVALRHGDVVRYRMATMWWHQVNHPEGVRRVLQENNHNYPKSNLTASILRPVAGEGLFISEGRTWLRQRRLMQPAFHRQKIAAFGELMTDATLSMLDRWDHRIDAAVEMTRLTLDVATDALFHAHVGEEPDAIARAELDEVLDGAPPAVSDLPKLPYSRMVIEEAMRLYPPAWITDRQAIKEDEILGHHIPAGGHVIISPYVTHRLPTLWEDPEKFDPTRFSPENSAIRPRYAYFPFGGGPRQCIGKGMALMEAHLILTTVMQRYRLRLAANRPVEPQPTVTLRPRGGLPMTVELVS